jgi:GNAT superfamily N-acetyltransferase
LESSLAIRNYQSSDLESCHSLWRELTEWHRQIYEDPTIGGDHPEDQFDKHLAAVGASQIWVAIRGSQVLGLVGLILRGNEAEVEPIVVSETHRSEGIGSRLIERAIAEAGKRGVRVLTIKPVARNVKTIQFLHEHGFKNVGFIELFMDLSQRPWKSHIELFGRDFQF